MEVSGAFLNVFAHTSKKVTLKNCTFYTGCARAAPSIGPKLRDAEMWPGTCGQKVKRIQSKY